jgi:NADH:ubiquinone oxidoreductase subunit F (NADH-binding)
VSARRSAGCGAAGQSNVVFVEGATARAIVVVSVVRQRRAIRDAIAFVVVDVCIEESSCSAVGPCRIGTRRFVSIFIRVMVSYTCDVPC